MDIEQKLGLIFYYIFSFTPLDTQGELRSLRLQVLDMMSDSKIVLDIIHIGYEMNNKQFSQSMCQQKGAKTKDLSSALANYEKS
jgi:ribonuclease HI